MNFIYMSISAACMILTIIGIRKLLINKVPHLVFEFLWLLVLVRLYIPYDIETKYNFYNLVYYFRNKLAIGDVFNIGHGSYYIDRTLVEFISLSSFQYLLILVWIVVGLMVLSYFWHDYVAARRIWKNAQPAPTAERVNDILKERGQNKRVEVRESKEIGMPMAYGILHPTIILPVGLGQDSPSVFEQIILHEYMHLRYHHPLLQHILVLILCVNWFNPLIWTIYHYMGRDMEISCDLHVLDQLGEKSRESYALCLLEMAGSKGKDMTFFNGFTKHLVKERTIAIMKYRRTPFKAAVFSLLLPVMVFWFFGTSDNYIFGDEIEAGELELVIEEVPTAPMQKLITVPFSELEPYLMKDDHQTIEELRVKEFMKRIPLEDGLPVEIDVETKVVIYQYKGTLRLVDGDVGETYFTGYYSGSLYKE